MGKLQCALFGVYSSHVVHLYNSYDPDLCQECQLNYMEFYAGQGAVFQQVSQVFRKAVAIDIEYGRHMKSDRIQNNPHDILGEAGLASGPKIQLRGLSNSIVLC